MTGPSAVSALLYVAFLPAIGITVMVVYAFGEFILSPWMRWCDETAKARRLRKAADKIEAEHRKGLERVGGWY